MATWFKLTSRNDGDQRSGSFEWDCHRKGNLLRALTVAGVDPCTAQAAKEAGFEWHGASDNQTKEMDGLRSVSPLQAYAIYFPLGSDEATRVQEYFGDVAAEQTAGSMSLLEWLVLMQVIPSTAASNALDEWTAEWRHNRMAPVDTLFFCKPDEERLRIVIAATEVPMLAGPSKEVEPVKYAGPPAGGSKAIFPSVPAMSLQQVQSLAGQIHEATKLQLEDDFFEEINEEDHT